MEKKSVFSGKDKKKTNRIVADGDMISIDCRGCGKIPDPGSSECISCIVKGISENGCASGIRLRTGKDMEISGKGAELFCELALIYRSGRSAVAEEKGRCRTCKYSCRKISELAWEKFPEPDFAGARGLLMTSKASGKPCGVCIQKTYRILDQAELSMSEFSKKVAGMKETR
jgi:hypothetical protein